MSLLNENNEDTNLTKSHVFKERLKANVEKLKYIIEDYTKNYISHFRNPTDDEYANTYQKSENQLHSFRSELFEIKNQIDSNSGKLNNHLNSYDTKINKLKKENEKLEKLAAKLNQTSNTSSERISNYQTEYELQYLKNWALALTFITALGVTGVIFTPVKKVV